MSGGGGKGLGPAAAALLLLLAEGAAQDPPVYDVRKFGARADRRTNDAPALQAAVDACHKDGGGVVLLPAGDYLSGAVRLRGGVTLKVGEGATLWASTDRANYGGGRHLLSAEDGEGISVVGPGTIHGQGTADYGDRWGKPEKPPFRTGILLFDRCRDVSVRDLRILFSDAWTLHFRRCEDVTVSGVVIRNNYRRLNSDGIDPNMCRRVRIRKCDIVAGDDCIVLKATEPHPCEDVVVEDCTLESAASAIKLGTESHGDFRDIRFENCTVRNTFTGIGLYLKDGGTMENVAFRRIRIEACPATVRVVTPIFVDVEKRHEESRVGALRNLTFEDIDIRSGSGAILQGMPESPIEKLALRRIRFEVAQADDYKDRRKPVGGRRTLRDQRDTEFIRLPAYVTVAHVRGIELEGLSVKVSEEAFRRFERSAFCGRYLEGGRLAGVTREPGPGAGTLPVVDLKECGGVEVRDRVPDE